jgi:serine protease
MPTSLRSLRQILVLSVLGVSTLPAIAADARVYVVFSPGQKANAQAALKQADAKTHHEFDNLNAIAASMPEGKREALARNPVIALVEDDPVRGLLAQSVPYGVTMVQAPEAVAAGATGAGIKVGVIDTGVSIAHEDLQTVAIAGEPDFGPADQRTWYRDVYGHGTHVVGTLTAANNSLGVVGVSPGAVSVYMVKVFGDTGNWVYSSDLLTAARTAQARGARIISMSLGGSYSSLTEQQGFEDLYKNKGVLLIAAAGNDGTTGVSYPAGYPSVVSVAAINSSKVVASFSQKNSDVELAAPGVSVQSTVPTGYAYYNGTSMAAPHVSGVAALIWSKYPGASNVQVRTALTNTAEDLGTAGRDASYGFGLVRAKSALDALATMGPPGGGADAVAPVISNVTSVVKNAKNGSFEISWKTTELSTSDVQLNGTVSPDSTLTTLHRRAFRGSKGSRYTYYVYSSDAAGNMSSAGPFTHQN